MSGGDEKESLRAEILALTRRYAEVAFPQRPFRPGLDPVRVSGKVFDGDEIEALVDASLDFWLTAGRFADRFEKAFAAWMDQRHCLLVNSGSSANLLAITALLDRELGEDRLVPGDEVLTVAAGFPTTLNPILQNQLVPVFLDVEVPGYNLDVTHLEAALSPRTRAIFLAHTLGNPFDLGTVAAFAEAHGLWLVEDCCDAVGSLYRGQKVGTFGDLATASFYPAHHLTMGEGGAVLTSNPRLRKIVESLRDWGRDCWCPPGRDNTCGRRFKGQFGSLPRGYDHKYTYSRIGYNLKLTDMQAAVGVAQLDKLDDFVAARRQNFAALTERLADLEEHLLLPRATPESDPSWFGYPILLRETARKSRRELVEFLDSRGVATRLLFGGNLTRQPAYQEMQYRVAGDLATTDRVMNQAFWVGVFPELGPTHLDHLAASLREALT